MSFVPLIQLQVSPSALAVGFSVLLLGWLVAAEEVERRRGIVEEAEG